MRGAVGALAFFAGRREALAATGAADDLSWLCTSFQHFSEHLQNYAVPETPSSLWDLWVAAPVAGPASSLQLVLHYLATKEGRDGLPTGAATLAEGSPYLNTPQPGAADVAAAWAALATKVDADWTALEDILRSYEGLEVSMLEVAPVTVTVKVEVDARAASSVRGAGRGLASTARTDALPGAARALPALSGPPIHLQPRHPPLGRSAPGTAKLGAGGAPPGSLERRGAVAVAPLPSSSTITTSRQTDKEPFAMDDSAYARALLGPTPGQRGTKQDGTAVSLDGNKGTAVAGSKQAQREAPDLVASSERDGTPGGDSAAVSSPSNRESNVVGEDVEPSAPADSPRADIEAAALKLKEEKAEQVKSDLETNGFDDACATEIVEGAQTRVTVFDKVESHFGKSKKDPTAEEAMAKAPGEARIAAVKEWMVKFLTMDKLLELANGMKPHSCREAAVTASDRESNFSGDVGSSATVANKGALDAYLGAFKLLVRRMVHDCAQNGNQPTKLFAKLVFVLATQGAVGYRDPDAGAAVLYEGLPAWVPGKLTKAQLELFLAMLAPAGLTEPAAHGGDGLGATLQKGRAGHEDALDAFFNAQGTEDVEWWLKTKLGVQFATSWKKSRNAETEFSPADYQVGGVLYRKQLEGQPQDEAKCLQHAMEHPPEGGSPFEDPRGAAPPGVTFLEGVGPGTTFPEPEWRPDELYGLFGFQGIEDTVRFFGKG